MPSTRLRPGKDEKMQNAEFGMQNENANGEAASGSFHSSFCNHQSAFTLIELLVVIGIMAILAGLLTVGVNKAIKKAHIVRLQGDLQTISQALEAYKSDFGDYPRLPAEEKTLNPGGMARNTSPVTYDTGTNILCWALIAPADAGTDGADGPGFTKTPAVKSGTTYTQQGRKYGPYLDAGKFKTQQTYPTTGNTPPVAYEILDMDGNPILYYAARPTHGDLTVPTNYVGTKYGSGSAAQADQALYNADDGMDPRNPGNLLLSAADLLAGVQAKNFTGPFILWCAGQDGKFGTGLPAPTASDIARIDDATNMQ
ncbi:MAG TPA: type II secretion system protein [Tepidisphaeraceae bacterium]|jgi:prepilin-type N-terminal cleavage/methylation domain-containing protein